MSSGPARRPSPGRQKAVGASKRPVAAGSEIKVNVILDTKARREYPESLTHAEVKVQAGKTIAWFLDEVKKEFGTAVPIQGVRRLKADAEPLSDKSIAVEVLAASETVVAFAAERSAKPKLGAKKTSVGGGPSARRTTGGGSAASPPSTRDKSPRMTAPVRGGSNSRPSSTGGPSVRGGRLSTDSSASSASFKEKRGASPSRGEAVNRMYEAGKNRNALLAAKAAEKAAAEEAEAAAMSFAPKTNVITKRKLEEKDKKLAQKASKSKTKTLEHLVSGGWRGSLPLPNSIDPAATVVAVFRITAPATARGDPTEGWLKLLPEGHLGGPDGLIMRWTAYPKGGGSATLAEATDEEPTIAAGRLARQASSKTMLGQGKAEAEMPMWDLDLHFPAYMACAAVPALLRYRSATEIEFALSVGDKDTELPGLLHPSKVFGTNELAMERPNKVDWPNTIMSLTLCTPEELEPPPPKKLQLGTSLKNVAQSILKEIKNLVMGVLQAPTGKPLREGEKRAEVCVRLWNIKMSAKVDVDPFWSVLKLRVGLARIMDRFPLLKGPDGALSAPTFLAQAMEDEKDGSLGDRLSQVLTELSEDLDHLDAQFTDQGFHSIPMNEADDVEWFVGSSNCSADPLSAYIGTAPGPVGLRHLRLLRRNDERPTRPCDFSTSGNPLYAEASAEWADMTEVGGIQKGDEKGKRGALIMQAERNKKALENGTYGQGYVQGAYALGMGAAAREAPEDSTVNGMRLFKLERNQGRSLNDEDLGAQAEGDMNAANAARIERRGGSVNDPRVLTKMRAARMAAMERNQLIAVDEARKDAAAKASGKPRLPTDAGAAAALVKHQNAMLDMRFKRQELHRTLTRASVAKRARPESVAAEALKEQAMLGVSVNKTVEDPAEVARRKERILAARKRKLMDFLPGAKGKRSDAAAGSAGAGTGSSKKAAKPAMSAADAAAEAEMLAILKGINTSSNDKFSGGFQPGPEANGGAPQKPSRPQVKDFKKTADIAKARLDFIASGGNPEFE